MNKYFEGTIEQVSSRYSHCSVDGIEDPIIIGSKYLKKALTGDSVLVKVKDDKFGFVQKIIKRSTDHITGQIQISDKFAFVKPWTSGYYKDFFIPKDKINNAKDGDVVEIKMVEWKRTDKNPKGEVCKTLYHVTSDQFLMYRLNLPTRFPDSVLKEVQSIDLTSYDYIDRLDLRKVDTITIDPDGSKDLDDSLSIEKTETGFRIGIHIADVSHFIKPGTELDKEAFKRAYTTYLPQFNIPMLPAKISSNLCSLVENKDRLTVSVLIYIDSDWNIEKYDMKRTVTRSKKQFTYEEAEEHRNDKDSKWYTRLNMLNTIGMKLRKEEFPNEIELNLPEVSWVFDDDNNPIRVKNKKRIPTMGLVQCWMLLANKLVTKKIESLGNHPWLYRTHNELFDDNILEIKKYLKQVDMKWDDKLSKHENITKIIEEDETGIMPGIMVKKFRPAKYSHKKRGHFAIGTDQYAHFTSPIRRYADILVHRILLNALSDKPMYSSNMEKECKHLSDRERVTDKAEKQAHKLNCLNFAKNVDFDLKGNVTYFSRKGILIKTDLLIDGWINNKELVDFEWNEKVNKWEHKDYNIKLGDILDVKILKLDWDRKEIQLELV